MRAASGGCSGGRSVTAEPSAAHSLPAQGGDSSFREPISVLLGASIKDPRSALTLHCGWLLCFALDQLLPSRSLLPPPPFTTDTRCESSIAPVSSFCPNVSRFGWSPSSVFWRILIGSHSKTRGQFPGSLWRCSVVVKFKGSTRRKLRVLADPVRLALPPVRRLLPADLLPCRSSVLPRAAPDFPQHQPPGSLPTGMPFSASLLVVSATLLSLASADAGGRACLVRCMNAAIGQWHGPLSFSG